MPNGKYSILSFTDQEDDDDLGLYNYNARLYDPELGRFLSADTIVPDPYNLQSLNRYSYVLNDPLSYTDPSGYDPINPDDPIIIRIIVEEEGLPDPIQTPPYWVWDLVHGDIGWFDEMESRRRLDNYIASMCSEMPGLCTIAPTYGGGGGSDTSPLTSVIF